MAARSSLRTHTVKKAKGQGWDTLDNGELMRAAEAAGFEVLLTTDKNLRLPQNLQGRRTAIVVLSNSRWRLVRVALESIAAANAAKPESYTVVDIPFR